LIDDDPSAAFTRLLNTQLTLLQAEDTLWQAQVARLRALINLYQALGGGWETRMEKLVDAP
jgi:multidrug efflux system outer membrane protein